MRPKSLHSTLTDFMLAAGCIQALHDLDVIACTEHPDGIDRVLSHAHTTFGGL